MAPLDGEEGTSNITTRQDNVLVDGNGYSAALGAGSGSGSGSGSGTTTRARAGTLPSRFVLGGGGAAAAAAGAGSGLQDGAFADSLLSPAGSLKGLSDAGGTGTGTGTGTETGTAAAGGKPDLLRRRLSHLPLGSQTPMTAGAASSSSDLLLSAASSILRDSQPRSPDPTLGARLRSGSLHLPPSGLGTAFTPGVFGPPGSGAWTPRSGGLGAGTPLGMPVDNPSGANVPHDTSSTSGTGGSGGGDGYMDAAASPTGRSEDPEAAATMSSVLDFLDDDTEDPAALEPSSLASSRARRGTVGPSLAATDNYAQIRARSPSQPQVKSYFPPLGLPSSSPAAVGSASASAAPGTATGARNSSYPRNSSPPSAAMLAGPGNGTSQTAGLLVPGRGHSGSLSVPSSTHPSIQNLRQTYQDHGLAASGAVSSAGMQASYSSSSSIDGSPAATAISSAAAAASAVQARMRANTLAANPYLRRAPSYNALSSSQGPQVGDYSQDHPSGRHHLQHHLGPLQKEQPDYTAQPDIDTPTRTLADLALEANSYSAYDGVSLGPTASSSPFFLNRPRASTIGILDAAGGSSYGMHQSASSGGTASERELLHLNSNIRKRAGTTAGPPPSMAGVRTPLYDGNADSYLESGDVAETEEEYEESLAGSSNLWYSSTHEPTRSYEQHAHDEEQRQGAAAAQRTGTPPLPTAATRSLWIGSLDSRVTAQDLMDTFLVYGAVETVRLLPEKDCAFVNFVDASDAHTAREDILTKHRGHIQSKLLGSTAVRLGFAKQESAPQTPGTALHSRLSSVTPGIAVAAPVSGTSSLLASNNSPGGMDGHLQTSPTRALWIGTIPPSTTSTDLLNVFAPFGPIESARVLANKQCGFCNFENLDDAVRARTALNGLEFLGPEVGPIKIGYARVPNKMPEAPTVLDDSQIPAAAAYQSLKRLGGATAVPLDEQISSGHLENFRSPMALQLAANGLNAVGPHSAAALTQSLKPAAGLSPSAVARELDATTPQLGVPMPGISEQQALMRELSGDVGDAEIHAQAVAEVRPPVSYYTSIPPPTEDQYWARMRNLDAPRLRDIRKRLEAPAQQVSQAEIDDLGTELLDDIVQLASDYIGNVIVQKLFEKSSSGLRLAMLERVAPFLASIACHKNGTWAAQKIMDIVTSPQEIHLVCHHLRPYIPPLLLDQFGNYAAQLCLRFYSPLSDFLFDAMVDRCWEIASGRFGARSMRTCLEHTNTTRLQHKRVAIAIILNSVLLAANANGALLLTWLLDTSNLPGRYRLLATRLAPHLSQLCPHKVASTTILKLVNQKIDPLSSQMLVDAIFRATQSTVLEDILAEQVHGSSFMYKLLQSNHIDHASKELAVGKIREVLQKSATHHSPAYAKLCHEVGLPAPLLPNNQTPHTPPTGKFGSHRGQQPHHLQSQQQYPHYNGPGYGPPGMPMGPHLTPGGPAGHHHPHTHNQHGHAGSPAFTFPSFGSPLSPAHRQASPGATSGGSPSPSSMYVPRQPSPYQPVYGGAAGADNHYAASYGSPYGMDSGYDMALRQQGDKQSHPPDGYPVQGNGYGPPSPHSGYGHPSPVMQAAPYLQPGGPYLRPSPTYAQAGPSPPRDYRSSPTSR